MKTVHEIAEYYGVSDAFMALALKQIGFLNAKPDTPLATPTLTRFEKRWGDEIRAKRREQGQPETPPPSPRKPKPHVMRVAHAKVGGGRDAQGFRTKKLLPDPGLIHAIDAAGTSDGDPWNGEIVPGGVHFFGGGAGTGPFAACGYARVRAVLGEEFIPEEEPSDDLAGLPRMGPAAGRQCRKCARAVAENKGFRTPPYERPYRSYFCEDFLRLRINGLVVVKECRERDFHDGPHRAFDKSEWSIGVDDYVPASHESGQSIARAS